MAPQGRKRPLGDQEPLHPPDPAYVPLWLGRGTVEFGFHILTHQVLWFGTHYLDDRIHPCLAEIGPCKPCLSGWIPRPRGFLAGMRGGTGGRYLLQVTPHVLFTCTILKLKKLDLRGVSVIIKRDGESRQSRWNWRAVERAPARELPPPPDVWCALSRLWGLDLRRLSACPPPDGDVTPLLRPYTGNARARSTYSNKRRNGDV